MRHVRLFYRGNQYFHRPTVRFLHLPIAFLLKQSLFVSFIRSHDVHLPEYPLAVTIEFNHNHLLDSTSVLRRRDVSPEMETKFIELMRVGHHPVAALSMHKYDLYLSHGANDFTTFINDRYYCPDLAWCYRYKTSCL